MKNFWKKHHKWVGLLFNSFILMFCFSGTVLNHRIILSKVEVNRSQMSEGYHYRNWNNGIIRGTLRPPDGKILAYGNAGIWQTDSCFIIFTDLNQGLVRGIDNRKISNITHFVNNDIQCAGLYSVYLLDESRWQEYPISGNGKRISDITQRGDTLVVLTRSSLYTSVSPYHQFRKMELKVPVSYSPKTSLFRIIWLLHNGELFDTPGKLAVDFLEIVLIILSIVGIIYTFLPSFTHRGHRRRLPAKTQAKASKTSLNWHNKLGTWLIVLAILLSITGMCLRSPLMTPFVLVNTNPTSRTTLGSDNPRHNKLRSIRWGASKDVWLLSSSTGFYLINDFTLPPVKLERTPPVSPMGVSVFCPENPDEWLIGSFSGLFIWNLSTGSILDYYTGQSPATAYGRPLGSSLVNGFTDDLIIWEIIFEYDNGVRNKENNLTLPAMPVLMQQQSISLWDFCLELYAGRCYLPLLGIFSGLFILIPELLLTPVLISGYITYKKHHRRNKRIRAH